MYGCTASYVIRHFPDNFRFVAIIPQFHHRWNCIPFPPLLVRDEELVYFIACLRESYPGNRHHEALDTDRELEIFY